MNSSEKKNSPLCQDQSQSPSLLMLFDSIRILKCSFTECLYVCLWKMFTLLHVRDHPKERWRCLSCAGIVGHNEDSCNRDSHLSTLWIDVMKTAVSAAALKSSWVIFYLFCLFLKILKPSIHNIVKFGILCLRWLLSCSVRTDISWFLYIGKMHSADNSRENNILIIWQVVDFLIF